MNVFISLCCVGVALDGYVAAIVCSRVQVERPRVSTSAGQSSGAVGTWLEGGTRSGGGASHDVEVAVVAGGEVVDLSVGGLCTVCWAQSRKLVQGRHLVVLAVV